jgi:hypothetical protein
LITKPLISKSTESRDWYLFLFFWLVFSFTTNYFIDVNGEEAYYWLFGQYPAWGYLDHPPMIGWLTALGYGLIPNALGLRLFMPLLSVGMIFLLREITETKNTRLFIWMCLGLAPLHAAAYLVKTDVPLLFFLLLFFYAYKRYLNKEDGLSVLWLIISIAGVMLSKYHGFIMIIFVVLSNLPLLKKRSFWLVVLGVTLLMLPHLLWQIEHDFVTFKFHLYGRKDLGFKWESVIYFFLVQPLVFGPLIGVILIYAFIKGHIRNSFDKGLKFAGYGVFIFFLYLSFKVEFHKHWTSVLGIPLMLYGFEYINGKSKLEQLTIKLSKISLGLLILAKVYLSYDFLPSSLTKNWDTNHGWQSWADEINELSEGLPIVFESNYERASRFAFLTGKIVHAYNPVSYRETQHDLLGLEDKLIGKKVFWINRTGPVADYRFHMTAFGKDVQYKVIENFQSFRAISIELMEFELVEGRLDGVVKLTNTSKSLLDFELVDGRQVRLKAYFLSGKTREGSVALRVMQGSLSAGEELILPVSIDYPLETKSLDLRFSMEVDELTGPINSPKYSLNSP